MKSLLESWRGHLKEGISDIVYHGTSLGNLSSIAKGDRIMTSGAIGTDVEEKFGKGKFYYLSTARTPSVFKEAFPLVKEGKARITLDGRKLSNRYSGEAIDYWKDKYSGGKAELEDRILTDEPWIDNISEYIKEIVVYLPLTVKKFVSSGNFFADMQADLTGGGDYELQPNSDVRAPDIEDLKQVSEFASSNNIPLKIIYQADKENEFFSNYQPSAVSYEEFEEARKELGIDPKKKTFRGEERDELHRTLRLARNYSTRELLGLSELLTLIDSGEYDQETLGSYPSDEQVNEVYKDITQWLEKPNFQATPPPSYDNSALELTKKSFMTGTPVITSDDIEKWEDLIVRYPEDSVSAIRSELASGRKAPEYRDAMGFITNFMRKRKISNIQSLVRFLKGEIG
jgi:hypothetical protein